MGRAPSHVSRFYLHFMGGSFGAGKSTLCQTIGRLLPAEHLKASELIQFVPDPQDATGKATSEVLGNQDRLIAALVRRRPAGGTVLLDGHFCLLNAAYSVVPLPFYVFERINPTAMVLLEATAAEIVDRLAQRDERGITLGLVQELVRAEREHSHAIANALSIPLMCASSSTHPDAVVEFLRSASQSR